MSKPNATIPDKWPSNLSTSWNMTNPVKLKVNNTDANVYLAVSCSIETFWLAVLVFV